MGHYSWNLALIEYGNLWKNGRRIVHEFLNAKAVTSFDGCQRKHTHQLLVNLSESPEKFSGHIELWVFLKTVLPWISSVLIYSAVASLVMEMTYGFKVTSNEDQFLRAAMKATNLATRAAVPGAFLVDIIPMRASLGPKKTRIVHLTVKHSKIHPGMVPRSRVPNIREGSS